MACFNREKLSVDNLDEKVVLLGEIWPCNPFMSKLARRIPTIIQEFMSKVEEFINDEETVRAFMEQAERAEMTNKKGKDPRQTNRSMRENCPQRAEDRFTLF